MKTKPIFFVLAFAVLIFGGEGCKKSSQNKPLPDDEAKRMIKNFYTDYITNIDNFLKKGKMSPEVLAAKEDSIIKKYCTTNHLKEFGEELDYVPYLKSQMVEIELLKTLTIQRDSVKNDIYHVSYYWPHGGAKWVKIKLGVIVENGIY